MKSFEEPSSKVWNLVMKSALDLGNFEMGILVYRQMRQLHVQHDSFTLPIVNQVYLMLGCDVRCAKMIHCLGTHLGFSPDLYFCNTLIDLYIKCGCTIVAHKLFDEIPLRDHVSWTSLISGYVNEGKLMQALELFIEMRRQLEPNFVTMITMLRACSSCWDANSGKQFHGYLLKQGFLIDSSVRNSLLQMYTNKGTIEDVENLFSDLGAVDIVSWNIFISFYSAVGDLEALVGKIRDMLREVAPTVQTLTLIASALSKLGSCCQGQELHCFATKTGLGDRILLTCLMDLYAKFGRLDDSVRVFTEVPCPTTLTWSTLMMGFMEHGQCDEAIRLFRQLQSAGVEPTANIIENLLDVCVDTGALHLGKEIHGYFFRNSPSNSAEKNSVLETAIMNMYMRCGSISSARHCFSMMVDKGVVVWTSMIEGLGTYGLGPEALEHFNQMLKEGIEPNPITFLSILSACSHAGLTHEGCKLLFEMKWRFGFNPDLNHYTCIVDLLGRSGKLKEALSVILKMAVCPDGRIWGALLSASRVYMDRKVGEYAVKRLVQLEPDNIGYQIVFSNMQASAERWDEVEELRSTVTWAHSNKAPGWSCIEVNGEIQGFVSGDRSHLDAGIIYELLGFLSGHMKDPDMYTVKLN